MKVFAISDLHMPSSVNKPMDIFGKNWENHLEKIKKSWEENVGDEDVVLLAGDFSWAMTADDVLVDFDFLKGLKGKKVLLRGNHDYWWQSISKVRSILPNDCYALQNDSIEIGNLLIYGSRGWTCPNGNDFTKEDEKLYLRETERLKLSLKTLTDEKRQGKTVIAMMHFPPFNVKRDDSNYTKLFEEYKIETVVYGHLHGKDSRAERKVFKNGVWYYLTSCDQVDFKICKIVEIN